MKRINNDSRLIEQLEQLQDDIPNASLKPATEKANIIFFNVKREDVEPTLPVFKNTSPQVATLGASCCNALKAVKKNESLAQAHLILWQTVESTMASTHAAHMEQLSKRIEDQHQGIEQAKLQEKENMQIVAASRHPSATVTIENNAITYEW